MRGTAAVTLLALSCLGPSCPGADKPRHDDLPPANAAVVKFCEEHAGKKVGNGQCGDLINEALQSAGAKPVRAAGDEDVSPVYGTPVERFDDALPGDVIEFRDAQVLVVSPNGVKSIRTYPHHAAVVARNRGGSRFDVFEQNVATAGADAERRAKTRRRDADLRNILRGTIRIYRPEAKDAADTSGIAE